MENEKGKIVVYKDGSHHYHKNGIVWEFETDADYLLTLDISEDSLKAMDYDEMNSPKRGKKALGELFSDIETLYSDFTRSADDLIEKLKKKVL